MILLFGGIALLLGILTIRSGYLHSKRRRDSLRNLASEMGLRFEPRRSESLVLERFKHINVLRMGSKCDSRNHISGSYRGLPVFCFDYHYNTESIDDNGNGQSVDQMHGIVLVQIPIRMSEVRIRRNSWFEWLVTASECEDIVFESAEFSRTFRVVAKDRRFAYDLIHPRAMEYLLRSGDYSWEFEQDTIALYKLGGFKVDQIRPAIETAVGFVPLIPPFIRADRGTEA